MWHEDRLLINGDLVPADGDRTYETIDPASGEPLGPAANASVADARRATEAARRAFDTTPWATDAAFRSHCLRQLHDGLLADQEDLALVSDAGSPLVSDPGAKLVGAVLDGRYRVDTLIATGGMSGVYRCLDLRLDRPVALKVMDSRYAGDNSFLTRFQREARAVAKLKDPGLVAVYDQGIDAAHPFLVMELVEGGTLREHLGLPRPASVFATSAAARAANG